MTTTSRPVTPASVTAALDVPATVRRLRDTYAAGRTRDPRWRMQQLQAVERLLTERESDLTAAVQADLGRMPAETWLTNITPTLGEVVHARRHLRRWMRPRRAPLPLAFQPGRAFYQHEPLGVVAVIGPWNYPISLNLCPLISALAAGNCVVIKPSEYATETAGVIGQLLAEYVDPDAVAVVQGGPDETQALIAQGLDHVFFTGSPEVGAKVMAAAAPHLTPVTLELGGKSPVIVAADADIDVAARRIALGKVINAGQTCIAPDYVLVDRSVQQRLVDGIRTALPELSAGLPPSAGRMVNARHAARMRELLTGHGGTVVCGGGVDDDSMIVEPTVVVDPDPASRLMQEEIFGPVLPVLGVSGTDEAIRFVRSRPKPLANYLFTSSRAVQRQVTSAISAGGTVVNHVFLQFAVPQLPFGGVGRSGLGSYHGWWGFETFSHRQAVVVKTSRPDLRLIYPPYTAGKEKLLRRLF